MRLSKPKSSVVLAPEYVGSSNEGSIMNQGIIISLLCLCLSSCVDTATSQSPKVLGRSQIVPITYDGWQSQEFEYIGLRMDLPAGVRISPSAKGPATLSVSMHYLAPPPGLLIDSTVFVHIYVDRLTLAEFAEQKASYLRGGLYKKGSEEERKIWFWYYDLHTETTRWDGVGNYSYYRRDVKVNDKEILNVHAEVLNGGPKESQESDHAAVKRIIDSIEPLIVPPSK